ncbi:hypothetical protein BV25DRAFT_1850683 [Artomyces pyxidatus]|uniref:Uncharacterized protein n=1 Tax=Artomyces pyxidatus TaxID=48021 RepID=A0ACB8T980_9AGAM|nr:hypothetical protein BV25DRAFT_1850683 [Artomyces pyxidatus]
MLVDYGSDVSDDETPQTQTPSSSRLPVNPSVPAKKASTFSLPPPSSSSSTQNGLPVNKTKKAPKKIAIDLPALPTKDDDVEDEDIRPAKKARLDTKGAGASTLFSMLPAPKQKVPIKVAPERVLGGGKGPGLVFNTSQTRPANNSAEEEVDGHVSSRDDDERQPASEEALSLPFLPPSLAKGRSNISLEDNPLRPPPKSAAKPPAAASSAPAVDFFSLNPGQSSSSGTSGARGLQLPKVSSAPKVDEFLPPEPTPTDQYPGYYILPSGTWAAYDPEYYQTFYKKWQADYDAQVRALEKRVEKGFEGADADDTKEVNAQREMEKAKIEIQEREEKKALTQGASGERAAPRMNVKGAKLGKGARTRNQLTTLLTDAYENRELLEAKIAEGRRNRKEAGNKYGF